MGIYQKNYLFNPESLARELNPYHKVWTGQEGYLHLAEVALNLFKTTPRIRRLCEEYGSWDMTGIQKQYDENRENVTMWIMIIIYKHIIELPPGVHWLSDEYKFVENFLLTTGTEKITPINFIYGDPLSTFARDWLNISSDLTIWETLKPQATSSSIGWWGHQSIDKLSTLLEGNSNIFDSYKDIRHMLEYTKESLSLAKLNKLCVLLIASG